MIMKVPNMFVPADAPFGSSILGENVYGCWCNHQEYSTGVRTTIFWLKCMLADMFIFDDVMLCPVGRPAIIVQNTSNITFINVSAVRGSGVGYDVGVRSSHGAGTVKVLDSPGIAVRDLPSGRIALPKRKTSPKKMVTPKNYLSLRLLLLV